MTAFKLSSRRVFRRLKARHYILIILVLVLVGTQVERLINRGTIFGYQVLRIQGSETQSNTNKSKQFADNKMSKQSQKSVACDTFPADKISKIVGTQVERMSGFTQQGENPVLVSSCAYRTKPGQKDIRTISILIRDQKDQAIAQKTLAAIKQAKSGEDIKELGDEAYFNKNTNQLTVRKNKRLITVTVPRTKGSGDDNKALAIEIVKIGL